MTVLKITKHKEKNNKVVEFLKQKFDSDLQRWEKEKKKKLLVFNRPVTSMKNDFYTNKH